MAQYASTAGLRGSLSQMEAAAPADDFVPSTRSLPFAVGATRMVPADRNRLELNLTPTAMSGAGRAGDSPTLRPAACSPSRLAPERTSERADPTRRRCTEAPSVPPSGSFHAATAQLAALASSQPKRIAPAGEGVIGTQPTRMYPAGRDGLERPRGRISLPVRRCRPSR